MFNHQSHDISVDELVVYFLNVSDPYSMAAPKALETIGKTLHAQYERWQPRVSTVIFFYYLISIG